MFRPIDDVYSAHPKFYVRSPPMLITNYIQLFRVEQMFDLRFVVITYVVCACLSVSLSASMSVCCMSVCHEGLCLSAKPALGTGKANQAVASSAKIQEAPIRAICAKIFNHNRYFRLN